MIGYSGIFNVNDEVLKENTCIKLQHIFSNYIFDHHSYRDSSLFLISSKVDSYSYFEDKKNNRIFFIFGRIDSLEELKKEIENNGDQSDYELLLKGYEKYGRNVFSKIIGAFSIFIFDKKNKVFLCAKDHVGMRPIFYTIVNETIFFSSEIKLIKNFVFSELKMNREMVASFILHTCGKSNQTFYENIFRVSSGSSLIFSKECLNEKKYHYFYLREKIKGEENTKKQLNNLLRKIISEISEGYNSISSKMSGGLDSSTISAHLFKTQRNKKIKIYSAIFTRLSKNDHKVVDEIEYMEAFEDFYNTKTTYINVNSEKDIDPFSFDLNDDQPSFIINRYFDESINSKISKTDAGVIFDGFDGDSIIGYGKFYLSDLGKAMQIRKLFKLKKQLEKNGFIKKTNIFRFFYTYLIKPNLPIWLFKFVEKVRGNDPEKNLSYMLIKKQAKKDFDLPSLRSHLKITNANNLNSRELHKKVLEWPVWEHILDANYIDSAKYGVLEAFPFMDKRLMQFSLDIDPSYKLSKGFTRYILREASSDILPRKIVERKNKSNLAPAINNFFARLKLKKDYLKLLTGNEAPLRGLIDEALVQKIYSRNLASDNVELYKLISLARWMNRNNFKW